MWDGQHNHNYGKISYSRVQMEEAKTHVEVFQEWIKDLFIFPTSTVRYTPANTKTVPHYAAIFSV